MGMQSGMVEEKTSAGWLLTIRAGVLHLGGSDSTDQRAPLFPQLTDMCLSECLLNRRGSLDPMQQNRPQALLGDVFSRRFVLFVFICVNVSECAHESPGAHRGQTASETLEPESGACKPPDWMLDSNAGFCKRCTCFQRVSHFLTPDGGF